MKAHAQEARSRGVLFDLDGTLVTTVPLHAESWKRAFATLEFEYTDDDDVLTRGVPRPHSALRVLPLKYPGFDKLLPEKQHALADYVCDLKQVHFRYLLKESQSPSATIRLAPHHGVERLLEDLKEAGWKLAVASGSRNARAVLRAVGLEAAFVAIVSPDDVPEPGPSKTGTFRTATERLAINPRGIVTVEDSSNGVKAAHEAELPCVAVATSEPAEMLYAAGAEVVVPGPWNITEELLERVISEYRARTRDANAA